MLLLPISILSIIHFSIWSQLKFFCSYWRTEGSARPLFPQWSHHVYPQFLPGSHPNAIPHNFIRHRHSYSKHHFNLNNNYHSHHHNHKIDHRYHRNSIANRAGNFNGWLVSAQMIYLCYLNLWMVTLSMIGNLFHKKVSKK